MTDFVSRSHLALRHINHNICMLFHIIKWQKWPISAGSRKARVRFVPLFQRVSGRTSEMSVINNSTVFWVNTEKILWNWNTRCLKRNKTLSYSSFISIRCEITLSLSHLKTSSSLKCHNFFCIKHLTQSLRMSVRPFGQLKSLNGINESETYQKMLHCNFSLD